MQRPSPSFTRAQEIELLRFDTRPMRAFHLTWIAFCVAFFAWFAAAPLTPLIRQDLGLSAADVSNAMMASVGATIFARIVVGLLCDRYGPRRVYTFLLALSAVPVSLLAFAATPTAFIAGRLAVGVVGASFVITQYHMGLMFAPRVLGTANALTAGWGNMGGGLAQVAMPALCALGVAAGLPQSAAWRAALLVPAVLLLLAARAYWRWTTDTPGGNLPPRSRANDLPAAQTPSGQARAVALDIRTWALAIAYAICFGVELTMHNIAPLYFVDRFGLSVSQAGLLAGIVGLANIFARAAGGFASDLSARFFGLHGRVSFLFAVLLIEGFALITFGLASALPLAIAALVVFALFVNFSTGATFGVVPFVHRQAAGTVSGIVAAGGNIGAVLAALLFRQEGALDRALVVLGATVALLSPLVLLVRFSPAEQRAHSVEVGVDPSTWQPRWPPPETASGAQ